VRRNLSISPLSMSMRRKKENSRRRKRSTTVKRKLSTISQPQFIFPKLQPILSRNQHRSNLILKSQHLLIQQQELHSKNLQNLQSLIIKKNYQMPKYRQ
jgi:hypothetical protein